MKKRRKMITCFLAVSMFAVATARESTPPRLKRTTTDKLREKLADRSGKPGYPPFETFIIEDDRGQGVPISGVPPRILLECEQWMRLLVRDEWLPNEISNLLEARKDAFVREIPAPPGYPTTKEVGDFLILDYEIKTHRILLIESGKTLTARIQLPGETDLTKTTAKDILKLVSTFFTMPENAIEPDGIKIEGDDQLRVFRWIKGPTPEETSRRYVSGERVNWWSSLQLHFDGQILLISIPEIPYPPRFDPRMILPDRF